MEFEETCGIHTEKVCTNTKIIKFIYFRVIQIVCQVWMLLLATQDWVTTMLFQFSCFCMHIHIQHLYWLSWLVCALLLQNCVQSELFVLATCILFKMKVVYTYLPVGMLQWFSQILDSTKSWYKFGFSFDCRPAESQ